MCSNQITLQDTQPAGAPGLSVASLLAASATPLPREQLSFLFTQEVHLAMQTESFQNLCRPIFVYNKNGKVLEQTRNLRDLRCFLNINSPCGFETLVPWKTLSFFLSQRSVSKSNVDAQASCSTESTSRPFRCTS